MYSDTWADPGHQWKPDAWRSLATRAELEQQVYDYTKQSIEAFKAADALPDMVQIGNEIAAGTLWNGEYVSPVNESTVGGANSGYLWSGGTNDVGFDRLATLLSKGIQGARDGAGPGEEPLIMIHHDQGSKWNTTSYYFDRLLPRLQADWRRPRRPWLQLLPDLSHRRDLGRPAESHQLRTRLWQAGRDRRGRISRRVRGGTGESNLGFPVSEAGQQAYLQALVDTLAERAERFGHGRVLVVRRGPAHHGAERVEEWPL